MISPRKHQKRRPKSLDQRPKDLVNALLYGDRFTLAVPDLDRTDFLIVIGVVVALLGWRFFDMERLLQRPRIEVN